MRSPRPLFRPAVSGLLLLAASALPAAEAAPSPRGATLYAAHCAMCHGVAGQGFPGVYPPLAQSDWLLAKRDGAIAAVTAGLNEEITVNGVTYRGQMPPQMLDDAEVAEVLTFVLNSWGNPGGEVRTEDVTRVRATSVIDSTFQAGTTNKVSPTSNGRT